MFGLISRGREIALRLLNLEEMFLWRICIWCYVRALGCNNLCPNILLADLEFLLLIVANHNQKGLRCLWVVCSRRQ